MAETHAIRFGQFVVDRRTGLLFRRRTPIKLRRKGWQVLCHLAERPGALVSVDELLDAVWNGAHVTPQALTNVIAELRAALGDRARDPRYIETVHGLGYRFVAQIREAGAAQATIASANPRFLVGRTEELRLLQNHWELARSGRRQVTLVTGEAGIGKSTLVDAFVQDVTEHADEEAWVARGQCVEQHVLSEAYMPILGAIELLAGGRAGRHVRSTLRRYAPTWIIQMPGVLPPRDREKLERLLQGTTAVRMLREAAAFFEALAKTRPILLVIEDLHWSDPASLDFITSIAQRPGEARLMIVGTLRPVAVGAVDSLAASVVHDLEIRGRASQLLLRPFDESEVHAYLERRLGSADLAAILTPGIEARTGGCPLFIRSIIEQLVARGDLVPNGKGWQLARAAGELENELPSALRDFVEADLATLDAPRREILEAASVAGVDASVHELAACVGRPIEEVEADCHKLARSARLLRYLGETDYPEGETGGCYGFVHSLYQRSIYDQLPAGRRRTLHASVAKSLEQRYGEHSNEVAARLAAHHDLSGNLSTALSYLEHAAANAQRRFAYREGADYLRDALVKLATLPDSAERRGREAILRLRLGSLFVLCTGYSTRTIGETFGRAWALSREVKAVGAQFLAGMGLAVHHMTAARFDEAAEFCDYLLAVSVSSAPKLAPVARCWAAFRSSAAGRLEEARELLERDPGAEFERGVPLFYDVARMIDSQLALVLVELGCLDQARAAVERAMARSRASGTTADLVQAALWATEAAVLRGDTEAGLDAARLTIRLGEENGFPTYLVQGRFYYAWLSLGRRRGRGIAELEAALEERRRLGDRWQESILLGLLGDAHQRNGDSDGALGYLDEALNFVGRTGERHFESELLRLKGISLASAGEDVAAENLFHRAISLARSQSAKLWELRAAIALGRLLLRRGRLGEAREAVRSGYAALPEGFDEPDGRAARELLAELDRSRLGTQESAHAVEEDR